MRVVVTGATGFIGSHLVPELTRLGYEVAILSRSSSSRANANADIPIYNSDSYNEIRKCFDLFKPEIIIHLATLYKNAHGIADISNLIDSNIYFGTILLEAMKDCGIRSILNFGTRWQHLENKVYFPANLYAATKQAFSDILVYYSRQGICYKTIELCDTFGRNDTRNKIVDLLVSACKNQEELSLSPGDQILDIVCVDDVISYVVNSLSDSNYFSNEIVGLSGYEIRLRELGSIIEEVLASKGFLKWAKKPYRENEVMVPPKYGKIIKVASCELNQMIRKVYL